MHPIRQVAKLKMEDERVASYELGPVEEEPRRLMIGAVRLSSELAVTIADLIFDKVRVIRPDLVVTPEEKGKSKK